MCSLRFQENIWHKEKSGCPWARVLVQVTKYRRLQIGRGNHLDQSEATIYRNLHGSMLSYAVLYKRNTYLSSEIIFGRWDKISHYI